MTQDWTIERTLLEAILGPAEEDWLGGDIWAGSVGNEGCLVWQMGGEAGFALYLHSTGGYRFDTFADLFSALRQDHFRQKLGLPKLEG